MTLLEQSLEPLNWAPQKGSQEIFLMSRVFETLYEGTRGPGKTDALIMDFLQHVGVGWGIEWRGIIFRQTYKQLEDIKTKCNKWIPAIFPGAQYNRAEYTWTFPKGEELLLRYMRNVDDYWNYHGHSFGFIGFEELTSWYNLDCYKKMISCCRTTVSPDARDKYGRPMRLKMRATTNPYGPGHNVVKKRFKLPEYRGKVIRDAVDENGNKEPDRIAIHGTLFENKIFLNADPNYVDRIKAAARNPAELNAWLYGDWHITAGGMFDDLYEAKYHIVDEFIVPEAWRIERAFDWGSSRPFSVGWWAMSDGSDVDMPDSTVRHTIKGDRFRIGEWYGTSGGINEGLRLTTVEIATGIAEREIAMGLRDEKGLILRVKPGPADSSIFDAGMHNDVRSIADQMRAPVRINGVECPGVTWIRSDKTPGSRKTGWEVLRQLLKNSIPEKEGEPRERPGIFIFRSCKYWIEFVPSLPRDDKNLDDVNTTVEDHIGDETRYYIARGTRNIKSNRKASIY